MTIKQSTPSTLSLMVQGTTSDAGKSVLVAGLCRVLARRGVKVAPFKPQNMALNSAVTADGYEIGRAQAVQAQACRLEPDRHMNPVLLKPSSDTGAQVIIQGKALSNMVATDYHAYKKTARNAVLESFEILCRNHSAVLVEGAGSPAEINLREGDIANMGFAEAADVPVILIADIDRGGVFAHLTGTLNLLSTSEQQRVVGFVINRFRGDITLLESGLEWLEEHTGKPVLGVLPYLHNFHLEAEDAINSSQQLAQDSEVLRVVVPVLPRISNHTDFDALRLHPSVDLQFVALADPVPNADLIILPGSKNVRDDLDTLVSHGWGQTILRHLRYGGKLLGICGGFQMLGETITDLEGIESSPGVSTGLGLFAMETILTNEKQLCRCRGVLSAKLGNESPQPSVEGYEIHCGISRGPALDQPFAQLAPDDNKAPRSDGAISDDRQIIGTYLHGLFDHPEACNALLRWAGLTKTTSFDYREQREQQLDRLADCLEEHLDLPKLFSSICTR